MTGIVGRGHHIKRAGRLSVRIEFEPAPIAGAAPDVVSEPVLRLRFGRLRLLARCVANSRLPYKLARSRRAFFSSISWPTSDLRERSRFHDGRRFDVALPDDLLPDFGRERLNLMGFDRDSADRDIKEE